MKQLKMKFLEIPLDIKSIRVSLGLDKAKQGAASLKGNNNKNKKKKHNQPHESQGPQQTYHLDWAIVPFVPTQFPSLHRDVITLEEFAEGMAEVEEEMEREEEASRKNNQREVVTDSESDESGASDTETRSEDESSDSEMDEFIVDDDKEDTDKEEEEEDELINPENATVDTNKPTRKEKLKKELKNLGLSSGEVGESFAVATENLGKRTRRQTDHIAPRILQAGEITREIDDYNKWCPETKKFKADAYHKSGSTKSLWQHEKKPVLAITGSNAQWAKAALSKRDKSSSKKTKPGQRPCSATAQAATKAAKRNADIRSYLVR